MTRERPMDVIKRYLNEAIALKKNSEIELRRFAKKAIRSDMRDLFTAHAEETKSQYERLAARLEALGGSASVINGILARLLTFTTSPAGWGHTEQEKDLGDLVGAFAVQQSEIAAYELLAAAATAAGDAETERLARVIQKEEHEAAMKIWNVLGPTARLAFFRVTSDGEREVI
jgi:ferritin-like metal-binding protein YciE